MDSDWALFKTSRADSQVNVRRSQHQRHFLRRHTLAGFAGLAATHMLLEKDPIGERD
jgi:hypothetical protein